jgi:hypothetical protein
MSYNSSFLRDENLVDFIKNGIKFFNRKCFISASRTADFNSQLNNLKNRGFIIIEDILAQEKLTQIQEIYRQELEEKHNFELPCLAQAKIDPNKHKDMIENNLRYHPEEMQKRGITFDKSDFKSYQEAITTFRPSTLKTYIPQNKLFFDLWLNPKILDLVEAYMGMRPYLTEAYIRRNFRAEYKVMNHYWHRDNNHPFYLLKAFFFLSDCEIIHGPHEYIISSVQDRKLNGKTYYSDEEVDQLYPVGSSTRLRSIVKAGTVILEDTRGLHRAMVPQEGQRDLGYAVFFPVRFMGKLDKKYFSINKDIYNQLDKRQRSYILPDFID